MCVTKNETDREAKDPNFYNGCQSFLWVPDFGGNPTGFGDEYETGEEFFENFPIPVSIWTISSEGTVVSQRGNGLICKDGKCIDSLFESFGEKVNIIEAHKGALKGQGLQNLIEFKV